MASRKVFSARPSHIYPYPEADTSENDVPMFEFDESDVWSSCSNDRSSPGAFEPRIPIPNSRPSRKTEPAGAGHRKNREVSGSLPVNIPDWPAILKGEYRCHHQGQGSPDGCGDLSDDGGRVPPHEFLAQRRGASFSVHEGIGRTLKGRDLRRVRNAIWQKTGFED